MNVPEELAAQHWSYIEALLTAHSEEPEVIAIIGFHYRSALIHGFKHGVESARDNYDGYSLLSGMMDPKGE